MGGNPLDPRWTQTTLKKIEATTTSQRVNRKCFAAYSGVWARVPIHLDEITSQPMGMPSGSAFASSALAPIPRTVRLEIDGVPYAPSNSQPLRYCRERYLLASATLVIFMLAAS